MEEWVGQVWHKLITRAARSHHPQAGVKLEDVRRSVTTLFRALGGDSGLRVEAATEWQHGAKRSLLSRIAGSNHTVDLAWCDDQALRLPLVISCFAEERLNRELYLWLSALAAVSARHQGDWLQRNSVATAEVLARFPGMRERYSQLVMEHLRQRPDPSHLPAGESAREAAITAALKNPGVTSRLPDAASGTTQPVPLWLHPEPPVYKPSKVADSKDADDPDGQHSQDLESNKRRKGERVKSPEGRGGLLAFRLESLFTRAEFVAVDRPTEDNEDKNSKSAVEDLNVLSMASDRSRVASRLRFDLDLPPEDNDDIYLGEGISLPEWDYRQQAMQPDYCRLQPMIARNAEPTDLPRHLQHQAKKLRAMFELIRPYRQWHNAQPDGSELDMHALIGRAADRLRGHSDGAGNLYRSLSNTERDLSCLLLADLSLSTDAYVDDEQRVIDVIRDGLFLFSETLSATGDRFAVHGFSSRRRSHVRFHTLKEFSEPLTSEIRGRIQDIRPGYYTRMGTAIRYACRRLQEQRTSQRLLLILTDGKPNDLDRYEGRYGIEDTRMAVHEATQAGIQPFCVTIDRKAGDYLPYLFGSRSYLLVRSARELPAKLPLLYARLTAN